MRGRFPRAHLWPGRPDTGTGNRHVFGRDVEGLLLVRNRDSWISMPNDTPAPAAFGTRAALPRVWSLAWPLILSNITVPLLGLVDTAVLGHLPQKQYIGAVALGATLFSFLFWGFGFLRMGVTGLTAQALGRGNHAGVILLLGRSLLLAAMLGLALIALRPLLVPFGLALL